jgi:hypothetical protein
MYYLNCKNIETAIKRAKKMLIMRAKEKGLYENFGQHEVRSIEAVFIDLCNYDSEMSSRRILLNNFNEWCMNYNGREV